MTNQPPEASHDEVAEYRAAKAADDGERVGLDELISELDSTNRRSDAARIASEIRAVLENNDEPGAFRRFLQLADNLATEHGASRVALALTEPAATGSDQWDAAIAALCEYRLAADALPVPEWVHTRTGHSSAPWAPRTSDYDIPVDVSQVPAPFLSRGILIEAATLESV